MPSAPSIALRSPIVVSGTREFALMIETISSFSTPRFTSFSGGRRMPSWKMSVSAGDMLVGTAPPTSAQ